MHNIDVYNTLQTAIIEYIEAELIGEKKIVPDFVKAKIAVSSIVDISTKVELVRATVQKLIHPEKSPL